MATKTLTKSSVVIVTSFTLFCGTIIFLLGCNRNKETSSGITNNVFNSKISSIDFTNHVKYLASDKLEGRMTGSEGTRLASEYLAAQFKRVGLEMIVNDKDYFQEFEFTSEIKVVPGQNQLKAFMENNNNDSASLNVEKDFLPLSFTSNGEVEGEVVFAGYGISVPSSEESKYDSYASLDVRDKIVLVLRYVPEGVAIDRRQELNHYASLRYKAMLARERGAKALLVFIGPNSPNSGDLIPLSLDNSLAGSGIVAASISEKVARILFASAKKELKKMQSELDIENPNYEGSFPLPGVRVRISTAVDRVKKSDRNVVGMLASSMEESEPEYIIIGAHYDHIGRGERGGSLAKKEEEGQIHNGADDNASGTAVVLELAEYFSNAVRQNQITLKRNLVFALWSGEEIGLVGSSSFIKNSPVPLGKAVAYINFDMVGRLRKNKLVIQGVGSSSVWPKILQEHNGLFGFNLVLQNDPYLPTDVTAFYPENIPVLNFFTGSHENYNRPSDDSETLNYEGMEKIAKLAKEIIQDLAQDSVRPDFVKVESTTRTKGQRQSLRAFLGTIPDYITEGIVGVKLSSVRSGSPADKAGLRGGDVIVEFSGQKITNIYDYTYVLNAVKIGVPVELVVLRNGNPNRIKIIPEARN